MGREPGIRGWLFDYCQVVSEHYKTAMGYKALAHRFRLAVGLPEPYTLEDILDALSESIESIEEKEKSKHQSGHKDFKNSEILAAAGGDARTAAGNAKTSEASCIETIDVVGKDKRNELMDKAKQRAETILKNLRIRNRKDRVAKGGRVMWRATWVLDELLHDRLKLLRVPRSA